MKRTVLASVVAALMIVGLLAGCTTHRTVAVHPKVIAQKTCPVMGGPINPKFFTDYHGRRIYFCCSDCVKEFKKDPEKYVAKVDAELKAAPDAGSKSTDGQPTP